MNSNSIKTPQLEDGFTQIANELLEALSIYPFTGGELKALLVILRCTYGYNRKTTSVSIKMLMERTRLSRRYVLKILKSLRRSRVISVVKSGRKNIIGINKNYTQWGLWISVMSKLREFTTKVNQRTPIDDLWVINNNKKYNL